MPYKIAIEKHDGSNYGYKWASNSICDIFIIRLRIIGKEHPDLPDKRSFYTDSCVVEKIIRLRDGREFTRLNCGAIFRFDYRVNHQIDEPIYYCKSIEDLNASQSKSIRVRLNEYESIRRASTECSKKELRDLIRTIQQRWLPVPRANADVLANQLASILGLQLNHVSRRK